MAKHAIIVAHYQDIDVPFTDDGWFNATAVAAKYGKRPNDWLLLPATKEYLAALDDELNTRKSGNWIRAERGKSGGTWLHPDLAVQFARWLDVRFAIWCDRQIKALLAGAHQRLGTQWTRGAVVMTDKAKLVYDGPTEPEKLWEDREFVDCRGVKVGTAKFMRYRPVFMEWACEIELAYSDEVLDRSEIEKIIRDAGQLIGVCEYRPRFGRFTAEVSRGGLTRSDRFLRFLSGTSEAIMLPI